VPCRKNFDPWSTSVNQEDKEQGFPDCIFPLGGDYLSFIYFQAIFDVLWNIFAKKILPVGGGSARISVIDVHLFFIFCN